MAKRVCGRRASTSAAASRKTSRPLTGSSAESVPTSVPRGSGAAGTSTPLGTTTKSVSGIADARREQAAAAAWDGAISRSVRASSARSSPLVGEPALQARAVHRTGTARADRAACGRRRAVRRTEPQPQAAAAVVRVRHVGAAQRSGARAPRRPVEPGRAAAATPTRAPTASKRSASAGVATTQRTLTPSPDEIAREQQGVLDRPALRDRGDKRDVHCGFAVETVPAPPPCPPSSQSGAVVCTERKSAATIATTSDACSGGDDPQPSRSSASRKWRCARTARPHEPPTNSAKEAKRRHAALGEHLQVGVVHHRYLRCCGIVEDVVLALATIPKRPGPTPRIG